MFKREKLARNCVSKIVYFTSDFRSKDNASALTVHTIIHSKLPSFKPEWRRQHSDNSNIHFYTAYFLVNT